MADGPETEWPEEIWAAERSPHDVTGIHVFSEHSTIARFDGDVEREREFHRYVDGDINDSLQRYCDTMKANYRAALRRITTTIIVSECQKIAREALGE